MQLIHSMNMNEFCYFFVVGFWSFFSTELNTLSENEPIDGQSLTTFDVIAIVI